LVLLDFIPRDVIIIYSRSRKEAHNMRIQVTGRNVTVGDELSSYAQEKIGKLERYFDGIQDAQVLFTEQKTVKICEVTMKASGKIIRAEYRGSEFLEAVDFVAEKLERQIRRYKEKFQERRKEGSKDVEPVFVKQEQASQSKIVRVKEVPVKQMNFEEAIMQMELLSHDFFVFYNPDSKRLNILYRRKDGDLGILEPIEA